MSAIKKGAAAADIGVAILNGLGYNEGAVKQLFADTRIGPHLVTIGQSVLVPMHEKQASEAGRRRIYALLMAGGKGGYAALKSECAQLLDEFFKAENPDFVASRMLSSNLPAIHALIARGFYPVEVLIHSFYSIESAALVSDQMSSDVRGLKAEDAEAAFALMQASGLKSHIHMDPNLPADLGDLALMMTIENYIGKPNAVVSKRQGKVAGFLAAGPRKVPLAGCGPTVEAAMGAVAKEIPDAWNVMRDMLGVLYNILPEGYELFEIRVPSHAFNELSLLFESKPSRVETSIVLHWLKP
ncbi:MAG: hypothetical protein ACREJQ_07655 [bacterium]